jgi:hypothetical protein
MYKTIKKGKNLSEKRSHAKVIYLLFNSHTFQTYRPKNLDFLSEFEIYWIERGNKFSFDFYWRVSNGMENIRH